MVSGSQPPDGTFRSVLTEPWGPIGGGHGPFCSEQAYIVGPSPWCHHVGRQKGIVAVLRISGYHLGGQWPEQRVQRTQEPGDTRVYCCPAQRCLGAVVDSLRLVSGDIAGPSPEGLGCWADAGTPLCRQRALEKSEQGSISGAVWTGGLPGPAQHCRTSQRPLSENFRAFVPGQLAWPIFRQCYFCSFQKVEAEKKRSCK